MSNKRIGKELKNLQESPLMGKLLKMDIPENLSEWRLTLLPQDPVYRTGAFDISISFPADYPFKAPTFKFLTKIYHPNIDSDGAVCLNALKTENWKPASSITDIFALVVELLAQPNPDDPLDTRIANIFVNHRPEYEKTAREWVETYAAHS